MSINLFTVCIDSRPMVVMNAGAAAAAPDCIVPTPSCCRRSRRSHIIGGPLLRGQAKVTPSTLAAAPCRLRVPPNATCMSPARRYLSHLQQGCHLSKITPDSERWSGCQQAGTSTPLTTMSEATRDSEAERWTARISETFVPLHARPLDKSPFFGQLRTLQRGPLLVALIEGSAQQVRRGPLEIAAQDRSAVYLNLQIDGVGEVRNRHAEMLTAVGSGAVVSSDESFTLRFEQPFRQLCIAMPADWFADRLGFPATTLLRRNIDTKRGIGRVVRAAVDAVIEAADREEVTLCGELFGQTLAEAMRRPAEAADRGASRPDPLLLAIRSLIRTRLAEVNLTPTKAAAALGCSLSTLHLHCQRGGRSFTTMLQEARLDTAATLLRSVAPAHGQVEMVAFACGFGDPSHFARRFKARYGVPPSLFQDRQP